MNRLNPDSPRIGWVVLALWLRHGLGRLGLVLVCALGCWPDVALALEPSRSITQYNTRTWRRVDRLPSNSITAIVQAADGHLWLGTPRGLVDFDGVEFKAVGLPGQDATHSRVITSLAPRSTGGLWVGTERGGWGSFDGMRFSSFPDTHLGGDSPTVRNPFPRNSTRSAFTRTRGAASGSVRPWADSTTGKMAASRWSAVRRPSSGKTR
jgi:hypothetical protein